MLNSRIIAKSLLAATALVAFASPAAAQRIDRIVTFGDSYADDGNFFALAGINPATTGAYTTGRFSGGTNYIDTLGQILNVPIENFAIGGARAGIGNQSNPFSWGFTYEVDQFLGVGVQSPVFPTIGTFDEGDLVTVSIGGNDSRAYQLGGGTVVGAPAVAGVAAGEATANLDRLVAAGAPTISFLAGDTGLLPEVAFQPSPATAAAVRTAFSTTFNNAMQSTLAGYAADGVMVHYLDLTAVLNRITADFAAYGLSSLACPAFPPPLGPGVPGSIACITGPTDAFLFYGDQLHLTSAGFRIVARYVAVQLQAPLTLQGTSELGLDTARQFGRTLTGRANLSAARAGDRVDGLQAFVVGDMFSRDFDANDTTDKIEIDGVGATAGVAYGFAGGVAGIAVNFSRPKAKFGAGDTNTRSKSWQVGAFAGTSLGGGFAQGYVGYGKDAHDIERQGVIDQLMADADGSHWLAGVKGGYLMPLLGLRVGPTVALDYAKAKVDGYTEEGDAALSLNVDSISAKALTGSLGLELRGDVGDGSSDGAHLRPFVAAAIEKNLIGDGRTMHFSQTASPIIVNRWELEDRTKKAYGRVSIGASATIFNGVALDTLVSSTLGHDDGDEVSAHLGLRLGF